MAIKTVLKASGLQTFANPLGSLNEGALVEALNVNIDRTNTIEPRRGLYKYSDTFGSSSDRVKQTFNYKGRVLRHQTTALQYDNGTGTFASFTGSVSEAESGLRTKSIESNGNLYFTTSEGIKKLSALTNANFSGLAIATAGAPKALDLVATCNYTTTGFLTSDYQVAYRVTWAIKDSNENLIEGSPSQREVVSNVATSSCYVDLNITIPDDVTVDHLYRVYRTGIFESDPGEEFFLIFEDYPSSADITAGFLTVSDQTPEDYRRRGTPLYTNPQTGEGTGIAGANEKPPLAKDITLYKGYSFLANTQTPHRLTFSVLGVTGFVSNTSTLLIKSGATTETYTFRGTSTSYSADFGTGTGADFLDLASTTAEYFKLHAADNVRKYVVYFDTNPTSKNDPAISGYIPIRVVIAAGDSASTIAAAARTTILAATDDFNISIASAVLTITCADHGAVEDDGTADYNGNITSANYALTVSQGTGEDSATNKVLLPDIPTGSDNGPTTSQQIEAFARSLVRVINKSSALVEASYISGATDVPGKIFLQRKTISGVAFYLWVGTSGDSDNFSPEIPTSGQDVISENEAKPNRLHYSKYLQPDAFPLSNYIDIGPKDRAIKRILALRDSLFIFKEDGIYRLSSDVAPFQVTPFDFSVYIVAPDTAAVLNNEIYCLCNQGVVKVTDTGATIISRPIEDQILNVVRTGFSYETASFGVSYESDRAYLLWTVTESTDTVATQCFRYNIFTNTWTRWDVTATCGIVNFDDDTMYIGAGDGNWIDKERKSKDRTDYADRIVTGTISVSGVNEDVLSISSVSGISTGDRIVQTQYLTAAQFNRLLQKLDNDPTVNGTDYYSTLVMEAGSNIRNLIDALATKLDADSGVTDTDYLSSLSVSTDFDDLQTDFNALVTKLNADTGVFYTNYSQSSGTADFEAFILDVDDVQNEITLNFEMDFLEGPFTVYKAYECVVTYAPQFFDDPSIYRQVSEGTVMFEDNNFYLATVAYGSDLNPSFEEIEFEGLGDGDWGYFSWGSVNWGGVAAAHPLRTYVPLEKQRCRFINVQFKHAGAREKFSLLGYSLKFRNYSTRAYK